MKGSYIRAISLWRKGVSSLKYKDSLRQFSSKTFVVWFCYVTLQFCVLMNATDNDHHHNKWVSSENTKSVQKRKYGEIWKGIFLKGKIKLFDKCGG